MSAEESVERVLARAVPDHTPLGVERIEVGNRKRTFRVRFDEGPALSVQYVPNYREHLVVEGALLREIANRTAVPVPSVVAYGPLDEGSYLLTEWVAGTTLGERFADLDSPAHHAVAHALGRHLAALHAEFEFDAFGPLTATSTDFTATTGTEPATAGAGTALGDGGLAVTAGEPDWRTSFRDLVDAGLNAFRGPLTDLVSSIRAVIESTHSIPRAPTPRLFPWDYRPGNVLVHGDDAGGIAAVLDWESPRSAHREFSLAKTEYLFADWYAVDATNDDSSTDTSAGAGTVAGIGARAANADGVNGEAIRTAFYAGYEARLPIPAGYWRERRRLYRLGAIVRAAFDSQGAVTRPGYPMVDADRATRFHCEHLRTLL